MPRAFLTAAIILPLAVTARAEPTSPAVAGVSARDLGARYGQALGAVIACPGMRVTKKAESLSANLNDVERDEFKQQAALVVALWRKIPLCDGATNGPNQCKIANDLSCREAFLDIGPEGRLIPGLIEWDR